MSNYFGQKGQRIELALTVEKAVSFSTMYGDNTVYTFSDAEGNVFVWKTTSLLGIDREIQRPGCDWTDWAFEGAHPRDGVKIKATVKDHSEYKGVRQTVLTRCKVLSITHAPTKEELDAARKVEQLATLRLGDFIWEMPYRQYKEHYADCETVAGSFNRHLNAYGEPVSETTIEVIIREGRLVPSGVRGQHFKTYHFAVEGKGLAAYKAVSRENAENRLHKDFPGAAYELKQVI